MKGYLLFTSRDHHPGVDATFIPETSELVPILNEVTDDDTMEHALCELRTSIEWEGKLYEKGDWPFNDKEILGTFYLLR